MTKKILTMGLVLFVLAIGACGVDDAVNVFPEPEPGAGAIVALLSFVPTPAGWQAPYPGADGDGVRELRAVVRCRAPSLAIMLCAHESVPNLPTLEECTWSACATGDVLELVTPTSFVQYERAPISVLVASTTSPIADYDVVFAEARVQPGVTW